MRSIIIGAMLLFLNACAQTTLPSSVSATDWQAFGKQTALMGSLELSEDRIAKLDDTNRATPELSWPTKLATRRVRKSIVSKALIFSAYKVLLTMASAMI